MSAVDNLLRYFTAGTEGTRTLGHIGVEVETHFVDAAGAPISAETSQALLALDPAGQPWGLAPELGRQLLEVWIEPCDSVSACLDRVATALSWLYAAAARHGAHPLPAPVLEWDGPLLRDAADSPRDAAFIALDGRAALEELTRIASVQFTLDVNPADAINVVNTILAARLAERDYPNDAFWRRYIAAARAGYHPSRYGGPTAFSSIEDYARYLASHPVIMRDGRPWVGDPAALGDDPEEISLFLRSVWNYCRLRRYGDTLTVEVRPFARGADDKIERDLRDLLTRL